MTNSRKLIIWFFISICIVVLMRIGIFEPLSQYLFQLRNTYLPSFSYKYDDYLPYLPLVILFGLKIAGVQGRSTWKQLAVSIIFCALLLAMTVPLFKSLAGELRPDGSDYLSFPSGHTATSFIAAGILWKEYSGCFRWIRGIAFLPAVITGLTRILNNRHWLSDVIAGATIGLLIVESGYFFSDLLFHGKKERSSIK